jgi:hypothetical protein
VANAYVSEVSTIGHTVHYEDIARRIVAERSELRYETILSVLQEYDAIVRDALLSGNWEGVTPHFDPAHHKITLDISPSIKLNKVLDEEVGMEIIRREDQRRRRHRDDYRHYLRQG